MPNVRGKKIIVFRGGVSEVSGKDDYCGPLILSWKTDGSERMDWMWMGN
jgi:hypothetical protein